MVKKAFFIWLGWTAVWTVGEAVAGTVAWLVVRLHNG